MLPRNFRRLAFCTSPRQLPEFVPGLPDGTGFFTQGDLMRTFNNWPNSVERRDRILSYIALPILATIWFLPGWLYRITLKSTAWFWWPLAYLGDAPSPSWHPGLYHRLTLHSLRGRSTIVLAVVTIAGFILINLAFSGAVFETNPLLTMIGFLFLLKRDVPPWQILSVAIAVLSLWIVVWLNEANIARQYGTTENLPDVIARAERKFRWTERLGRLRLVLFVLFQLIVAGQALLYFNERQYLKDHRCWFNVPETIVARAQWLYGAKMPGADCRGPERR